MTAATKLATPEAVRITRLRRPIAALPTIVPGMLLPRTGRKQSFPFSESRTCFFYLGRGAVWHAMRLLSLQGEEVLVPAYHHGVEVEAMLDAGVKPRFYGVRRTFDVDLVSLAQLLTPKTKAIYVIHYAGFPQPMDEIVSFAQSRNLRVIEDCALSLLSRDGQRPLGARGDAAIFCLYKTLPVPHGGALWMRRHELEASLVPPRMLDTVHQVAASIVTRAKTTGSGVGSLAHAVAHGLAAVARSAHPLPVDARPVGSRRFVPGQERLAASGLAKQIARSLDHERIVQVRRRNYYALMARVRDLAPPIVQELAPGVCPLFYPFWCRTKRALQARLAQAGVESIDFWSEGSPLVPHGRFPDVDALRAHILELPIHQDLELSDVDAMATAVRQAMGGDVGC